MCDDGERTPRDFFLGSRQFLGRASGQLVEFGRYLGADPKMLEEVKRAVGPKQWRQFQTSLTGLEQHMARVMGLAESIQRDVDAGS